MEQEGRVSETVIDQPPASTAFTEQHISYLDNFRAIDWAKDYKRRSFAHLQLRENAAVLEVGCGTGDDTLVLAQLVGPNGRVVGIDAGEDMIAEAKKRAGDLNLPVEYFVGNAHNLQFPDGTFDACRADQVFQHVSDPHKALSEVVRVARPGARIVICDPDWGLLALDHENRDVTRKILNVRCDSFQSGWIGRRLPALFKEVGLIDILVNADTFMVNDFSMANDIWQLTRVSRRATERGVITEAEASDWLNYLYEVDSAGKFFGAVTGFAVVGRKP